MKKNQKMNQFAIYFTYGLITSPAYLELKPASRHILILLYFKIRAKTKKGKKGTRIMTNREDIKLPYREIEEESGYKNKAIWTAFSECLAHGFIKVVKYGGGAKGDMNIYGITEDWREWEPGKVIREHKKNGKVGFQKKKISSPVGNILRSPIGNQLPSKNGGILPTGIPVTTKT